MKRLIAELNDYLAENGSEFAMIKKSEQRNYIIKHLSPENSAIYASLPEGVARQLTLDRDPTETYRYRSSRPRNCWARW